jgi:hypothetical protein
MTFNFTPSEIVELIFGVVWEGGANQKRNVALDCVDKFYSSEFDNRFYDVIELIFHQNIRGLDNKVDELLNVWTAEFPHII